jgi:hypothetical protein
MKNYTLMTLRISAPKDILEPIISSEDYKVTTLGKRVLVHEEEWLMNWNKITYKKIEVTYFEEDEIGLNIKNIIFELKKLRDEQDLDIDVDTFDCLDEFYNGSYELKVNKYYSIGYGDYKYLLQDKINELHDSDDVMPIDCFEWLKGFGKECLISYFNKRIEELKQEENIEILWY